VSPRMAGVRPGQAPTRASQDPHMCDSPPPDGCQGDPLRGQFDQTDGHGLALPVRSFLNADTAIGRQGLTRSTPLGQSETAPN
jgi:hypothetical protein